MTTKRKQVLLAVFLVYAALLGPFVSLLVRNPGVVGANPQTFFGLGILAGLSLCGIALGIWQGLRAFRSSSAAVVYAERPRLG